MNDEVYDDMALEQNAKALFGKQLEVEHVVARRVPVSHTAHGTVFLTAKKELMVYLDGQTRFLLDDVRKILTRMGLVAEFYFPPKGKPHYFDEVALAKYSVVYPGRRNPSDQDLEYYRGLAPYQPALVQILEVRDSNIYQFDTDSKSGWRPVVKFAYRRIKTS
ncbi:MAG TPA: hypothetical protein VGE34_01090 [Candidatus Saccharimonadales bacterium]